MTRAPMAIVLLIGAALTHPLFSQDVNPGPPSSAPPPAQAWAFSVAAYTYFVPDETNYVSPYIKADRKWLHLEWRYNYEDQETASAWIGYNFRTGNNFVFEITPMVGAVFGKTQGVAPGALMSMAYRKFDLSTESEYVFDTEDQTGNFFYTWSELGYSPADWLRIGVAGQRTRAYETPLELQRGPFVGVSYKNLNVTTYVFNLGWTDPTIVLAATWVFP